MDMHKTNGTCDLVEPGISAERESARSLRRPQRPLIYSADRTAVLLTPAFEAAVSFGARLDSRGDDAHPHGSGLITMAEFMKQRFIPDFVMTKRSAGRTHFRSILKHVLPPELVAMAFGNAPNGARDKLSTVPGWPYLDRFHLTEISADTIQRLTARALEQGYSIQTATHIRNVIRSIFGHAIRTGHYAGRNPAEQVVLPAPARERARVLTLNQLTILMSAMRYPEKEMALFAILTGMNVGEICGLHWMNINLSNMSRIIGHEVIPPRTIAVRNQSHRGTVSAVIDSRQRFIRVPRALERSLAELRRRKDFIGPHDLVLVSRIGTPIHPENLAARRLKLIGKSFGIPWLTWSVFYRTRLHLGKQFGPNLQLEFEQALNPFIS